MDLPEHLWRFPTAAAIENLATLLGVPNDVSMQDWQWQIADSTRIDEYLGLYQGNSLTDDERFTLMETIIQSFADLPTELSTDPRWETVLETLDRNIRLHAHSVWYWATLENESLDDCWTVTPFMRKLVDKHSQQLVPKNR